MSPSTDPQNGIDPKLDAVVAYKTLLKRVLEQRPSGTRQRLAQRIGKNRSFISQITNPSYKTPIPYQYLDQLFEICHFSHSDTAAFLECYRSAHPERIPDLQSTDKMRSITIDVPVLGNDEADEKLHSLISEFAVTAARLLQSTESTK